MGANGEMWSQNYLGASTHAWGTAYKISEGKGSVALGGNTLGRIMAMLDFQEASLPAILTAPWATLSPLP
jgi:hypothetical protein